MRIRVKNWSTFQHYKRRNPPWIRLYRSLLDDYQFHALSGDDAKLLILIWLIAADDPTKQGVLPDDEMLAFRLRVESAELPNIVDRLSHWLSTEGRASTTLAPCKQVANPETEAETEAENKHGIYFSSKVENVKHEDNVSRSSNGQHIQVEPLNSDRANRILNLIVRYWPKYSHSRETAARLAADKRFTKLNEHDVIAAAHTTWPPGRDVHSGNGLHGFLSAFFSNAARDAQKEQSRNTGQSEATRATIYDKLSKIDSCVRDDALIDCDELRTTITEAVEDKIAIPARVRSWLATCTAADAPLVQLLSGGKIQHCAEVPMRPSVLARGMHELPGPDELAEIIGKIGRKF